MLITIVSSGKRVCIEEPANGLERNAASAIKQVFGCDSKLIPAAGCSYAMACDNGMFFGIERDGVNVSLTEKRYRKGFGVIPS